jgi:hypothetical protein
MNNRELFIRWFAWSVKYKDCDPAIWMTNYLHKRFQHNKEQRLWFAWLYGNTYNLPTAWVLINEFPDFELATVERITEWNTQNYKRLRYQTDTKWNKGHLPVMFESYKNFVDGNQQETFNSLLTGNTPTENFDILFGEVKTKLHKFGRYSTWFYLQHLKDTVGIDIEPSSLLLNDYSGSKSHRNGLLHALDKEELIDHKLTPTEYFYLEEEAKEILLETRERFPELKFDFFLMETALCSFKKIFRSHHGRYLGYYLDRQCLEIKNAELDGWVGIDWHVLWQARTETLDPRLERQTGIDIERFKEYPELHYIKNLDWMFDVEWEIPKESFVLEAFF